MKILHVYQKNEELIQIPNGYHTDGGPKGEYLEWIDLDNS